VVFFIFYFLGDWFIGFATNRLPLFYSFELSPHWWWMMPLVYTTDKKTCNYCVWLLSFHISKSLLSFKLNHRNIMLLSCMIPSYSWSLRTLSFPPSHILHSHLQSPEKAKWVLCSPSLNFPQCVVIERRGVPFWLYRLFSYNWITRVFEGLIIHWASASSHNISHTNVSNAHTKLYTNVFVCQVCQVSSHMRKENKFVGLAYYQGKGYCVYIHYRV
jgi:hypothetical protein